MENENTSTVVYDESKIRHLEDTEHIRTRPGMYIGRLGDGSHAEDGIYVLLKESIDNSIDEFNEGFGKRIEVNIHDNLTAEIRDYGRGIPLGALVDAVSKLNTGGKYDTAVFTASVGMNGVGLKAVNALSSRFIARSVRDGQMHEAIFEKGVLVRRKTALTYFLSQTARCFSTTVSTVSLLRICSATTPTSTPDLLSFTTGGAY